MINYESNETIEYKTFNTCDNCSQLFQVDRTRNLLFIPYYNNNGEDKNYINVSYFNKTVVKNSYCLISFKNEEFLDVTIN